MNIFSESIDYHHVPSTPSCSRRDPAAVLVPDIHCPNTPDMEFRSEILVPSTPICPLVRGVCCTLREVSADIRCSYVSVGRGEGCRQEPPEVELFTSFAEQVVPYTPRVHTPAPGAQSCDPVNNNILPTYTRAEVTKSRLATTPFISSTSCHGSKERQLSLFFGDEIFA